MKNPRIEGYAIVSADGMLANAQGEMPPALFFEADQAFFHRALENAAAMVHGRNSHERYPPTANKPRLIATRSVTSLQRDPSNANALLWNPAGASIDEALNALESAPGTLAVIGGTDIFGLFLPRYDAFHLSRAPDLLLPGGRPVFPQVPAQTPEQVLQAAGLHPVASRILDDVAGISVQTWEPENRIAR
jgi:dihydrofolate reductase